MRSDRDTGKAPVHSTLVDAPNGLQTDHRHPPVTDTVDVVLDLTSDEPSIYLGSRPELSDAASLLHAPEWALGLKRAVDVAGAALGLLLASTLLLVVAVAIKLTSPGPILFSQQRSGRNGVSFSFYKFRSMRIDSESQHDLATLNEMDGPVFKIKDDPRLTGIGRFIRRASIDELPQLWNVLRGDMSLVGPRPLPTHESDRCNEWEAQRLAALPGITCIWQVSGRSDIDFATWVQMDIEYIENWSFGLDMKLLAKSIPAVLSGRGAY